MGIAKRRPFDSGRGLQGTGEAVRSQVGERHRDEHRRPAPDDREPECDHEPDGAPCPDVGQPDEDVVEGMPPMVDDPTLPVAVERSQVDPIQTGTICFVCWIRWWRSNGLPTKACAPFEAASACACSSTLPLNMTTGITPAP